MNPLIEKFQKTGIRLYDVKTGLNQLSFSVDISAKPGSKKERIVIGESGEIMVYVNARPIDGAANMAISKLLAKKLGLSNSSINLDKGGKSRLKRFSLNYVFTDHKGVDYYLEKLAGSLALLVLPLFTLLTLFFSSPVFSASNFSGSTFEYTQNIRAKLETIKNLSPKNYFKEVDKYRAAIEKYIEHKKMVCNGEFSTIILSEDQKPVLSKKRKKLSKEERGLCFREMKALQITFVNNMFIARKGYLDYLHKLRIEELTGDREKTIKSIQNSFARKGFRR